MNKREINISKDLRKHMERKVISDWFRTFLQLYWHEFVGTKKDVNQIKYILTYKKGFTKLSVKQQNNPQLIKLKNFFYKNKYRYMNKRFLNETLKEFKEELFYLKL